MIRLIWTILTGAGIWLFAYSACLSQTTLNPGDLAFIFVNENFDNGSDAVSIVNLVPLEPGTEFILTDLGYQRNTDCNNRHAFGTISSLRGGEGFRRFRYSGTTTLPAGRVLTYILNQGREVFYNFPRNTVDATDWEILPTVALGTYPANRNTMNFDQDDDDQLFILQGQFVDDAGTLRFRGRYIYAFSTGHWRPCSVTQNNNIFSRLPEELTCYNFVFRPRTDTLPAEQYAYSIRSPRAGSRSALQTYFYDRANYDHIRNSDTVGLGGRFLPIPTELSITNQNRTICTDTTTILAALRLPEQHTGRWTVLEGNPTGFNPNDLRITPRVQPGTTRLRFTITNTRNNCSFTDETVIRYNPFTLSVNPSQTLYCAGQNPVSITASVNPGTATYAWMPNHGLSASIGSTVNASPSTTTTYTVTATNPDGCTRTTTVTVNVGQRPELRITPVNPVMCSGQTTVELTASGAASYVWAPATILNQTTGAVVNVSIAPNITVTVTVTGTNSAGCTATTTTLVTRTVDVTPNVRLTEEQATVCNGQLVTTTASGADNYSWTPDLPNNTVTGSTFTFLPTTTQTFTITGKQGLCTATRTLAVTVNPLPNLSVSPRQLNRCTGDLPNVLTARGAATFDWTPAEGLSATSGASVNATPATSTTYTVTGTSNGCTATATVVLSVASNPTVRITSTARRICSGNRLTLTATGNATRWQWQPATIATATNPELTLTPNRTTTYTLTGFLGDCQSTDTFTVFVENRPAIEANALSRCTRGTTPIPVSMTGATRYQWQPRTGIQAVTRADSSTLSLFPSVRTTYTITGFTPGGCSAQTTITIFPDLRINLTAEKLQACEGEKVKLWVTGASTYRWTPQHATTDTITVIPIVTTNYAVVGQEGECYDTARVRITVLPAPRPTARITGTEGCFTILEATGGQTYLWSNALGTNPRVRANPASTTTYQVTVTDAVGCTAIAEVTVTVPTGLRAALAARQINACLGQDATFQGNVTGATINARWWLVYSIDGNTPDSITGTGNQAFTLRAQQSIQLLSIRLNNTPCPRDLNQIGRVVRLPSITVALDSSVTTVCRNQTGCFTLTINALPPNESLLIEYEENNVTKSLQVRQNGNYQFCTAPITNRNVIIQNIRLTQLQNGCKQTIPGIITYRPVWQPQFTAPSRVTACLGELSALPFTISNAPTTQNWRVGVFSSQNQLLQTVNGQGNGTFRVNLPVIDSTLKALQLRLYHPACPTYDSVTTQIQVNVPPSVRLTAPSSVCRCSPATLTLSVTGLNANTPWSATLNEGGQIRRITGRGNTRQTVRTGDLCATTRIRLINAESEGCFTPDSNQLVTIQVLADPTFMLGSPDTVCQRQTPRLSFTLENISSAERWTLFYKPDGNQQSERYHGQGAGLQTIVTTTPLTQTTCFVFDSLRLENGCLLRLNARSCAAVLPTPNATWLNPATRCCQTSPQDSLAFAVNTPLNRRWLLSLKVNNRDTIIQDSGSKVITLIRSCPNRLYTATLVSIAYLNGCESALSEQVQWLSTPNAIRFTPPTDSICEGDTLRIAFTANGLDVNDRWRLHYRVNNQPRSKLETGSGGYSLTVPNVILPVVTVVVDSLLNLRTGCKRVLNRTFTVPVRPRRYPTLSPAGRISLCPNDSLTLTATGGDSLRWFRNDTLIARGRTTLIAKQSGQYVVKRPDACGLTAARDTVWLSFRTFPMTASANPPTVYAGQPVTLTAQSSATTYRWQPGNLTGQTVTVTPIQTTTYTASGIIDGCEVLSRVTATVIPLSVTVPNVFTPNGDNINDRFTLIAAENTVSDVTIYIFDRWGNQLWQGNEQGWDGQNAAAGTYYYRITYTPYLGSPQTVAGSVTLIR